MKKLVILACLIASFGIYSCSKDTDAQTTGQDISFVEQASSGNQTAIALGQLASDSSTDQTIKAFGASMVSDHSTAQTSLAARVTTLPSSPINAAHLALLAQLDTLKGRSFDSVYIINTAADFKAMQTLYLNESTIGSNNGLVNYAIDHLSIVNSHATSSATIAGQYK
ncbi:MAG: DUF4142 domain-containing protein [Flavitalea sp.]